MSFQVATRRFYGDGSMPYVLSLEASEAGCLALASNGTARVLGLSTEITDLALLQGESALNSSSWLGTSQVATTSSNQTAALWDLKSTTQAAVQLPATSPPLLSIAGSSDGRFVAIGTEAKKEDCFIFIYDTRNLAAPLYTYEDVHQDDILQLRFSKLQPSRFLSGSTDGLVNVFDLNAIHADPDDAITLTHNSDSTISAIRFFGPLEEAISALTHDDDFLLWSSNPRREDQDEVLAAFKDLRATFESEFKIGTDYFVNTVFDQAQQRLFLFGGQHNGVLHMSHINLGRITPISQLVGGHTATVRAVEQCGPVLLTGGEDSVLTAWRIA